MPAVVGRVLQRVDTSEEFDGQKCYSRGKNNVMRATTWEKGLAMSLQAISEVGGKTTQAQRVRVQLTAEIVAGRIAPGTRLDEVEQARRFGVSRTPIREAFRQLAALGLAETRPHRGVFVVSSAHETARDLFEACAHVMALCAFVVQAGMTEESVKALVDARDDDEIVRALQAATGNSVLRQIVGSVWGRVRPFCPPHNLLTDFAQALCVRNARRAAEAVFAAMSSAAGWAAVEGY